VLQDVLLRNLIVAEKPSRLQSSICIPQWACQCLMAEQGNDLGAENLLNGNLPKREVLKCQAAKRHRKMPLFFSYHP